jgi:LysR family glycine cleavage system transcriptional activator
MDGLGVALGRNPLIAPDLKAAAGGAVRLQDVERVRLLPCLSGEAIRRRKIKAFRDWLVTLAETAPAPVATAKAA